MIDTKPEIKDKQLEIILGKSESERFLIGDELNTFGRKVMESSILRDYPMISRIDLKIEVFKRCYSPFYSSEELERIIVSMRKFWEEQSSSADEH